MSHSTFKALIVDDEEMILDLMSRMFESFGAETITALDGNTAVELFTQESPDIVFTDYIMPEMDGIMLLRELKKLNNSIPVVLFTGFADKYYDSNKQTDLLSGGLFETMTHELKSEGIQADHLLKKPFSKEKIIKILKRYFPGINI